MNNSFAAQHPELIYEWSEKNLPLTPDRVSYGSNKRVWWRAACGHEWQTSVKSRSAGEKCPICSGARVVEGINDLATLKPELACEWAKKNELNPDAPLDNSQAECSIRNFVISRKNFVLIDTLTGAEASAIMFSMSETAKANGLKPYNYFEHLLTELPKHMKDNSRDMRFLDELLPWSRSLPESIRKEVKQ